MCTTVPIASFSNSAADTSRINRLSARFPTTVCTWAKIHATLLVSKSLVWTFSLRTIQCNIECSKDIDWPEIRERGDASPDPGRLVDETDLSYYPGAGASEWLSWTLGRNWCPWLHIHTSALQVTSTVFWSAFYRTKPERKEEENNKTGDIRKSHESELSQNDLTMLCQHRNIHNDILQQWLYKKP